MNQRRLRNVSVGVLLATTLVGAGTLRAYENRAAPETMAAAVSPSTQPATTQAKVYTAGEFLALAIAEVSKMPPNLRARELAAIADVQGQTKEVQGVQSTVLLCDKALAAVDERFRGMLRNELVPIIASAFARAGDSDNYHKWMAEPTAGAANHDLAMAYADGGNYADMDAAVENAGAGDKAALCAELALRLTDTSPDRAQKLLKKVEYIAPTPGVPIGPILIADVYARRGNLEKALAEIEEAQPDEKPLAYEALADRFDALGDHAAARLAKIRFVAALAKLPPAKQNLARFDLFTRQVELGDTKAAGAALMALQKHADELPGGTESEEKSAFYEAAARAAARLGDDKLAAQCVKAAVVTNPMGAGNAAVLKDQYQDELQIARAQRLQADAKGPEAMATVGAIQDAARRQTGFLQLLTDALRNDDVAVATAALAKLDDTLATERQLQVPLVARLVMRAWLKDRPPTDNTPNASQGPDPKAWAESFAEPADRALAARSLAKALVPENAHPTTRLATTQPR